MIPGVFDGKRRTLDATDRSEAVNRANEILLAIFQERQPTEVRAMTTGRSRIGENLNFLQRARLALTGHGEYLGEAVLAPKGSRVPERTAALLEEFFQAPVPTFARYFGIVKGMVLLVTSSGVAPVRKPGFVS